MKVEKIVRNKIHSTEEIIGYSSLCVVVLDLRQVAETTRPDRIGQSRSYG